MKRIIKLNWFLLSFALFLIWRWIEFRILKTQKLTVLLFHDVTETQGFKLEDLISILKKFGDFISFEDFINVHQKKTKLRSSTFLITFDDGFLSSGIAADRILNSLGVKSLFFICPSFIGSKGEEKDYFIVNRLFLGKFNFKNITEFQSPMNEAQIKELVSKGHSVGSHSFDHQKLSTANAQELSHQTRDSKLYLENLLSKEINAFAYPFGDIDSISPNAIKYISKNFRFNFTGIRGNFNLGKDHPHAIWRESINLNDSLVYCLFSALGGLDIFHKDARKKYKEMLN